MTTIKTPLVVLLLAICGLVEGRANIPWYDHSFLHQSITNKAVPWLSKFQINAPFYDRDPSRKLKSPHAEENPIIYISDLGGDYTGVNDSTTAFIDAINIALTRGTPNTALQDGIIDLGGVTIDLGGGVYLISKPLVIPSNYANLRIKGGTIRASSTFEPTTEFLITVGDNTDTPLCSTTSGNECNQNIQIEDLALDCAHVSAGGIKFDHTTQCLIGPNMFIWGFNKAGIEATQAGGTIISNAYLAEYLPGESGKQNAKSTGINLWTHDSYITNVIVFNALIGINVNGSANLLNGIHIWGLTGNSMITNLTDQIGILANGYCHAVRIVNCYFDWNHLVAVSPVYALSVENTFFLGGGSVLFKAATNNAAIRGFNMVDSIFTIGPYQHNQSTILVDESDNYKFSDINNVVIDGFQMNGNYGAKTYKYWLKTTATQKVLTQYNATRWIFDFNNVLLFKYVGIAVVDYSVTMLSSSVNHFAHHYAIMDENDDKTVIVEFDAACDATVYMKVDQSTFDPEI